MYIIYRTREERFFPIYLLFGNYTEISEETLSDKVSGTKPIYEAPEIEQDTESGNDEVSGLPSVPGDTESTEPLPDELNDSDSSLPIGPIVFVVIVAVGVVVILKRNKIISLLAVEQ